MSESTQESTGIKAHYGAQVAADLEQNTAERERIREELVTLEEQLKTLEHDYTLLLGVQRALGGDGDLATSSEDASSTARDEAAVVPKPRAAREQGKGSRTKKAASSKVEDKTVPGSRSKKGAVTAGQPTLVALVRKHLGQLSEPRSAAEISAALTQAHADRDIKATVVRTTLEGLVAKGQAERAKQGASVFYIGSNERPAEPAEAITASAT